MLRSLLTALMVHTSVKAAEEIEKTEGVKVEVIDLRTLLPLDIDTIVTSIKKTNRAIVVQEAQKTSGVAAEVIAQINEKAILHLEAPVLRVCSVRIRFIRSHKSKMLGCQVLHVLLQALIKYLNFNSSQSKVNRR